MRAHAETPPAESPALSDAEDMLTSRGPTPEQQPCDPVEALDQLNIELGKLREAGSDSALYRAHALQPQLFDDAHKKSFLHTENYVVKAAADRMVAYWEARAELFGEEGMLRPMDKSGALKDEDALALDRGVIQLLPQKDLDGHALIFYDPSRHDTKSCYSNESMLRVIWYIMHVAMEDPATRDNGFVLIVYPKQCTPEQIDRDIIAKGSAIIGSVMPLPWRGFHICHPCSSYNKYFPLVKMLSPTEIKDNIAVHFGTDEHVLQCMASYSLPADRLPKELGGMEELEYSKWISDRKEAEGEDALRVPTPPPARAEPESADEVMEDAPTSPQGSVTVSSTAARAGTAKASSGVAARSGTAKASSGVAARSGTASLRSGTASPRSSNASPASSSPSATAPSPPAAPKSSSAAGKTRRPGRKGDARMHRAVTVKIENADKSLVEALQDGGFNFDGLNEKGRPHHEVFDQDGVSLMQRKNQLLRRIRVEKKKKKEESEAKGDD
eukprot:CAMPEP_0172314744 /NCGR_PEP_ID=MMETSP1058-20130122/23296_1 /TAXON_ID=83371 /ORGANISM="Detonula confervacea, Strain CCMP 353" /LENGTH=498 /DNA_ID=CAMNT_0013028685 /DNA_START=66 /DNA_END=1562 /DNA_ORIENTATION=+